MSHLSLSLVVASFMCFTVDLYQCDLAVRAKKSGKRNWEKGKGGECGEKGLEAKRFWYCIPHCCGQSEGWVGAGPTLGGRMSGTPIYRGENPGTEAEWTERDLSVAFITFHSLVSSVSFGSFFPQN